jgi:predicted dithiol-disulfide oxidoreductase (DUF899 family)
MGNGTQARAIAVVARSARSLWLGSLATFRWPTDWASRIASASHQALKRDNPANAADRDTTNPRYSFKYTNGTQTVEDMRALEFPSDRAARREALRTAREMANNVSWVSSQRGAGWTVLVINPKGQQICDVPVRFKDDRFKNGGL